MTAATVMAECEVLGVRAVGLEVDLTRRAAAFAAIDQIAVRMGGLDIAVCNAGGGTVFSPTSRRAAPARTTRATP